MALKLANRERSRVFSGSEIAALPWTLAAGPIPTEVTPNKSGGRRNVKGAAGAVGVATLAFAAVAAGYLSTINVWAPVGDGRVMAARGGYSINAIPLNVTVLAGNKPRNTFIFNAFTDNFDLPGAFIGRVSGGPDLLEGEDALNYSVTCIEGECSPGQVIRVPAGNIHGFPLGGD